MSVDHRAHEPAGSDVITAADSAGLARAAVDRLLRAGIATAESDVEALLDAVARQHGGERLFGELIDRRGRGEPLAHLTGEVEFRGLKLHVGPGVFVPQPETECVVEWALGWLSRVSRSGVVRPRVVDLCTGAGTVALAIAAQAPWAQVHAVEMDPGALRWAQHNVAATGVNVTLQLGDAGEAFPDAAGEFDLVVSNPPYVAISELPGLRTEVARHDPPVALRAGDDGLDLVRVVEKTARRLLKPGGCAIVEHSDRQGLTAPEVFASTGAWEQITDHQDNEGLDRFLTAIKR